jgi:hypothetical protein
MELNLAQRKAKLTSNFADLSQAVAMSVFVWTAAKI